MRSTHKPALRSLLAACLAAAFFPLPAASQEIALAVAALPPDTPSLPAVGAMPPATRTPDLRGDPQLARLWRESVEAEEKGDIRNAADLKQQILELLPDDVHTRWRLARDLMVLGEAIPVERKRERLQIFEEARTHASEAARDEPGCVECCFYNFAATSRIATVKGPYRSIGLVKASGEELERCLALDPSVWADTEWNLERGNLYYGAATYYRMLPDTWWMERLLGFRGDKAAATRLARQAVEVSPSRIDYRVELGIALVCLGEDLGEDATRAEGLALFEDLDELPVRLATDALDRHRAAEVTADPASACGNARSFRLE